MICDNVIINIIDECPICFNELLITDAILKPECCNNSTHLKCLIEWYTKNPENSVCFICQQENLFSKNICSKSIQIDEDYIHDEYRNPYIFKTSIILTAVGLITCVSLVIVGITFILYNF